MAITDIYIYKEVIKANTEWVAGQKLRKKFPHCKILAYRFVKDFRYEKVKDYKNRKMEILFVKNRKTLWNRA